MDVESKIYIKSKIISCLIELLVLLKHESVKITANTGCLYMSHGMKTQRVFLIYDQQRADWWGLQIK